MAIKLDMVGIVVKDMKKALEFYRTLGFSIPEKMNEEQHVEVEQDGFRLAFDTQEIAKGVYGSWDEASGHRIELAFLCDGIDALNNLYNQVIDHGYTGVREPWDAEWGQRYAIVKDPDGNLISLFV